MVRFVFAVLMAWSLALPAVAGDWPAWRGPNGNGVSSEKGIPTQWSNTKNVKWKTPLPGPGNSTPIVLGNRVFVSCASEQGKRRALLCFDVEHGKLLWENAVSYPKKEVSHKTNPQCSSSPASDGERVAVWHGSAGLYVFDLEGNPLWEKDLGEFQHIWGVASSPLFHKDLLIMNCGPGLNAFVAAFDKKTGREVWRRTFPDMISAKIDDFHGSWSTPVIAKNGNRDTLLLSLPSRLYAVDPTSGKDIWSSEGLSKLVYTSPLVGENAIVAMSGYHGPSMAVRPGGKDDVTATHRLWRFEEKKANPQRVGTGVILGQHLYILNEPGIAWCMEVATGKVLWKKRLGSGRCWTSMSHVDGRLYVINERGDTFVIEPDPSECKLIETNSIGELTRGSLAFSNGKIFIRTYQNLYCIEQMK